MCLYNVTAAATLDWRSDSSALYVHSPGFCGTLPHPQTHCLSRVHVHVHVHVVDQSPTAHLVAHTHAHTHTMSEMYIHVHVYT